MATPEILQFRDVLSPLLHSFGRYFLLTRRDCRVGAPLRAGATKRGES
jgi:hypothetical protein